jgi:hypothetical protein
MEQWGKCGFVVVKKQGGRKSGRGKGKLLFGDRENPDYPSAKFIPVFSSVYTVE